MKLHGDSLKIVMNKMTVIGYSYTLKYDHLCLSKSDHFWSDVKYGSTKEKKTFSTSDKKIITAVS